MRVGVSGGAPIAPAVIGLFLALGLDIVQGYGMTETSPVVSTNTPDDNDPSTVGRPLPGVEVRIGENSELMVRGASVMQGYWNRPEETQKVLGPDGWLHTGDQAQIRDGRIVITGRIKDIIVTSTGEKVPPADMELAILADPLFEQVMIVGEQRPFLSVLAVVQARGLKELEAQVGPDQLADVLLQRVNRTLSAFPSYGSPKAIWWTTEPWTIENTLLTPTLKLKRLNLEQRFEKEIAAMYSRRPRGS
ncbi:MAG: long-chain fatty acid--CoA ligase, partial [Hyphomicrobiales bacterium]